MPVTSSSATAVAKLLRGRVEVCDIGVVVLRVVELHDRAADDGLERRVLVAEGRQRRLGARMRLGGARGPVRFMRWRARALSSTTTRASAALSGCHSQIVCSGSATRIYGMRLGGDGGGVATRHLPP